jgi:hypothetical protein
MDKIKDIEGNEIQKGDSIWYATTGFGAKAILIKGTITKITESGNVKIINSQEKYLNSKSYDTFLSTRPEQQIILIESRTRKVLVEKNTNVKV